MAGGWIAFSENSRAEEPAEPEGELVHIERRGTPDKIKLLLKIKNRVAFKSFLLTGPDRVVINLNPCRKITSAIPEISAGPIKRLRCSQFNANTVRIVIDLKRKVTYSLSSEEGDPFLLVVDLAVKDLKKSTGQESVPGQKISRPAGKVKETKGPSLKTIPPPKTKTVKEMAPRTNPIPADPPSKEGSEVSGLESGKTFLSQKETVEARRQFFRYLNVQPAGRLDPVVIDWVGQSYRLEGAAPSGEKIRRQLVDALYETYGAAIEPGLAALAEQTLQSGEYRGGPAHPEKVEKGDGGQSRLGKRGTAHPGPDALQGNGEIIRKRGSSGSNPPVPPL